MTDDIDRAAEREQQLRDDALRDQARRAGLAGRTVADSAVECEDCSEPIPEPRRQAVPGVRLCVACQAIHERPQL